MMPAPALPLVRRAGAFARAIPVRLVFLAACVLPAAACTSAAAPLAPSDGRWHFTGSIRTLGGDPIAGAQLAVQDGANKGVLTMSDTGGHYAFDPLESGRFTMTIAAPGFVSITPIVDLYGDLDVNFALRSAQ
jgi:hypothetical protein